MERQSDLFHVVDALGASGASRAAWTAGRSSSIRTAMIAMTTNNSISVKPGRRLPEALGRVVTGVGPEERSRDVK